MTRIAPYIDARLAGEAAKRPAVGRVRSLLLTILQTPKERARQPRTRLRLIATLFGRASNVFMVALAALICGTAAVMRSGNWLGGAITAAEVGLLVARCGVILAFQRHQRDDTLSDPDGWLIRFGLLAIGSSVSWGALCFVCLAFSHDPVLYVIPVLSTVGTAGAVAARNSGVPRLAQLQLAASLTPIVIGSALTDDRGYLLLMLLTPAMAAGLLMLITERNKQLVELIETQDELARLSQTDALTLLPNRRYFDARLASAARSGRAFALLMIDVDSFKAFNDRHGHPTGDALLRQIAASLKSQLRGDRDVVARYGGEEFAVLLEGADQAQAIILGERLREAVQMASDTVGIDEIVTISIGVAAVPGVADADWVVREADEALYRAKRAGRNRVEAALPDGTAPDCKAAA